MSNRETLDFDFKTGAYGESVADVSAVEAVSLTLRLDAAPSMQLRIANPYGRRANLNQPGDRWEAYIRRGGAGSNAIFIGFQPPDIEPRFEGDHIMVDLLGYSARLSYLYTPVDANTASGQDPIAAVKDQFDNETNLNTAGLAGVKLATTVPYGTFEPELLSRLEIVRTILPLALDLTTPEKPLALHWVDAPAIAQASVRQVLGLDPTAAAPPESAALTRSGDLARVRRFWSSDLANAAWYKTPSGGIQEYHDQHGNYGKVHIGELFDDFERARAAVQRRRLRLPRFELDLTTLHLDLQPGDIVNVSGTSGPADGYWQITEIKHDFAREQAATTIKLAERSPAA